MDVSKRTAITTFLDRAGGARAAAELIRGPNSPSANTLTSWGNGGPVQLRKLQVLAAYLRVPTGVLLGEIDPPADYLSHIEPQSPKKVKTSTSTKRLQYIKNLLTEALQAIAEEEKQLEADEREGKDKEEAPNTRKAS